MGRTLVVVASLALGATLFLGIACGGGGPPDPEGTPHAFKGMVGEFTVE